MVLRLLVPVITGVVVAALGTFGLITSQTAAPAKNPASQQVIVYGDR